MKDERPREEAGRRTTPPQTVPDARDVRARLTYLLEAIELGDLGLAFDIARDLVDELEPAGPSASCPECGLVMWPGQVPGHLSVVHHVDPFRRAA